MTLDPQRLEAAAFEIFLLDDEGERESEASRWQRCRSQKHAGDCSMAEPRFRGPVGCSRCAYESCIARARQIVSAYLSVQPALRQGAEPVAWRWYSREDPAGYIGFTLTKPEWDDSFIVEPLFAAPVPPAAHSAELMEALEDLLRDWHGRAEQYQAARTRAYAVLARLKQGGTGRG